MLKTDDFDYDLPPDRIAQTPVEPRDASRLLLLNRKTGALQHKIFRDIIDQLNPGDLLIANDSKVIPARLFGRKLTGGKTEILLLKQHDDLTWEALVRGKRTRVGTEFVIWDKTETPTTITATVQADAGGPKRWISFSEPITPHLERLGTLPIPPYIQQQLDSPTRYQTVYAKPEGSAATPTAGLHFTPDLLMALRNKGIGFETVTLHVGLDTFKPVDADAVADHHIHQEWIHLSLETAERINQTKLAGGRIIAVGTTAVRTIETAAWKAAGYTDSLREVSALVAPLDCPWKPAVPFEGETDLFIYPGYQFRLVDGLITNFHLPRSSLLMLVSAFSSQKIIRDTYQEAISDKYRFYSFGDAMFIH